MPNFVAPPIFLLLINQQKMFCYMNQTFSLGRDERGALHEVYGESAECSRSSASVEHRRKSVESLRIVPVEVESV